LGIILFAAASSLKYRRAVSTFTREDSDSLKLRRKIRIWSKIIIIFVIVLIIARCLLIFSGSADILRNGYLVNDYILYFLYSAIFLIFWSAFIYLKKLDKYFKPETIENFQKKLTIYLIFVGVTDLIITGVLFISGYIGLLFPSSHILSPYKYHNPENLLPFLIILIILILVLATLYVLFIYKRSLHFLNQYIIAFFLTLAALFIFAVTGTSAIVGWNESLHIRATLLSWHYAYLGWIYILFLGTSIFSVIMTVLVFIIKRNFVDSSRIRYVILPLIKTGFVSILLTSILTIWPVLLTFI
jgi:hypothetical protein